MTANSLVFDSAWFASLLINGEEGAILRSRVWGDSFSLLWPRWTCPWSLQTLVIIPGFTFNALYDLFVWFLPPGLKFLIPVLSWLCFIGSEVF